MGWDGLAKNVEVVVNELKDWWFDMEALHLPRFRKASMKIGDKSFILHLVLNLITETIRALPRTLTYALVLYFMYQTVLYLSIYIP